VSTGLRGRSTELRASGRSVYLARLTLDGRESYLVEVVHLRAGTEESPAHILPGLVGHELRVFSAAGQSRIFGFQFGLLDDEGARTVGRTAIRLCLDGVILPRFEDAEAWVRTLSRAVEVLLD
jgi:hypothetical protein